jgi:hypothetical protein
MQELRCSHCGQAIGVYEPLMALADGGPRETSRAAEPQALGPGEQCWHRGCYEHLQGDRASER